jgi:hypothetical protein
MIRVAGGRLGQHQASAQHHQESQRRRCSLGSHDALLLMDGLPGTLGIQHFFFVLF